MSVGRGGALAWAREEARASGDACGDVAEWPDLIAAARSATWRRSLDRDVGWGVRGLHVCGGVRVKYQGLRVG